MIRPDIDGRLAQRLRELADNPTVEIEPAERARIMHLAADLLEEYVMDRAALGRVAIRSIDLRDLHKEV